MPRLAFSSQVQEAKPSASVILVRDGAAGLECFMVRRHVRSPVLPSAYVFPGGTLREDDFSVTVDEHLERALSARSDTPIDATTASATYVCAVRELFEEAGVLLVHDALASDADFQTTRMALQRREVSIGAVFEQRGWHPAFDLLVPFSHWITPKILAARFDTRFFVAALPPGQSPVHDTIETTEGLWLRPGAALEQAYHTVYATAQHLHRLAPFTSVADLLEFARTKPIKMVSPQVVESGDGLHAFLSDDLVDSW
jgi:8-oxo-dGTP pyrophosphatase MutT (NUDIX family)